MDATLRQMIESYIGSGLRGKAPSVSLDAIRERAATLARQGVPRADIETARAAGEEAAKTAYNDELRRAVDSVLGIWGTTNSRGSHQRVIRDFSNAADGVPVNPAGTDEERLQWALQVLRGGVEAYPFFSKRGFGGWQEAVTPLTRIYAPAAQIYPEWISDSFQLDESGIPVQMPIDYYRWTNVAPQLGFRGIPIVNMGDDGMQPSADFVSFVNQKRAEGFDFVAHRGNLHNYNNLFGFKLPNGQVVGQTRTGDDDDVVSFLRQFVIPVFSIAGGFAFLGGQIAGFTGIPANYASGFLRAAVATAGGQDVDRALLSALGPVVIQELAPPPIWQAPQVFEPLPVFEPVFEPLPEPVAELLVAPELPPELLPPPELVFEPLPVFEPVFEPLPVFEPVFEPLPEPVAELLVAPELPPELLPPPELVFEPLPVFEPVFEPLPEPVADLLVAPELLPELLPPPELVFEPLPVFEPVFEPLPVFEPVFEPEPLPVFEPLPDLLPESLPPTIETPGVPTMDDFFTADDYDFRDFGPLDFGIDDGYFFDGTFPGMDFDSVEPIPTIDAGNALDLDVMPMFPAIDVEDTWTVPVTGGEVSDLVTVGDINVITTDLSANYIGTGGTVETSTPAGATVVEILKDATSAMVAALGLVNAYRALTSKPAPNPVAQARQGANTVRANPNGTITTTDPQGRTRTARPPVGQPQMTTDGTMIVNNGDGTYTRIGRDGASVINRYPVDVTERFGAVAASPYTLPLLIGGAALVLFATRRR